MTGQNTGQNTGRISGQTRPLFDTTPPPWPAQKALAERFMAGHPGAFANPTRALAFLNYIFTPADGSWAFRPNGKTGTTSTLYFLFHLTFGHPLTVRFREPGGMNEDQAAHGLAQARIFAHLAGRDAGTDPQAYLDHALKLTTVRDPLARAVSGFVYLCRADELKRQQFFTERARMTAFTGFDWTRHPFTADGFLRFLEYLRAELVWHDTRPVDSHFRPQVLNILPALFPPDLIGRCEDLPAFFRAIATRLDRPVPEGALDAPARNRSPADHADTLVTPAARTLAAEVFAADYEAFGYTP